MSKYTEKSKEYTMKYMKENLEEIRFRVKKGEKDRYKEAAGKAGMSMAKFFAIAANEKIERGAGGTLSQEYHDKTVNTHLMKGYVIMPSTEQNNHFTIDDIYALPDGQRAELIDGQIYMMTPPSRCSQ